MERFSPANLAPIDLATLPSHLDRIATPVEFGDGLDTQVRADQQEREFLRDLAHLVRRLMQADFVVCDRFDESLEIRDRDAVPSLESFQQAELDRINTLVAAAAGSGRTEIDHSKSPCLIATVSGEPNDRPVVLATALDLGRSSIEPFVVTQQLITSAISTRRARVAERLARREQRLHGWIAELRESINSSESFSQLVNRVVDSVAINLQAHQVAFCRTRGSNISRIEVEAIGGDGTPINDSLWQAAASETLIRDQATRWPAESRNESAATIAHRELAQSVSAKHQSLSIPLRDADEQPFAVLVLVSADDAPATSAYASIGDTVARGVTLWRRNHRPLLGRTTHTLSRLLRARLGFIALTIVIGVIGMLPVPYRVSADATVVPHTRSFIVAPHTGLLRTTNVRIGDVVQRGKPVAELDDRELRIDMASLLAERDRAAKKRDIQRANGDVAEEQLAEYELARIKEQIKLTRHRLSNLVVTSPIDGVVLSGELEDVSGAPVETGQLLAEIAMLDRLWIEVNVPEQELAEIRQGQAVRVAFDATGGSVIDAHVESVSPSAQVRGGENVFVVRVLVENPDIMLRPGISGKAKINCDERPLVAVLMRQVWRRLSRLWI